jgi:N-acetylglucosamine kinase-like BadF-type ATPase
MPRRTVGIDLGGTKTRGVVLDHRAELLGEAADAGTASRARRGGASGIVPSQSLTGPPPSQGRP